MKFNRWDVVFVHSSETDATGHPAVVLSPPDILHDARQQRINVLVGTKKQPAERAQSHHVTLNGADGLDFLTLLDCSLVYQVRKAAIMRTAGSVGLARRTEIARRVRASLGLG